MAQIHRLECPQELGKKFACPGLEVTFGYQSERDAFSIWYRSTVPLESTGMVVGTGHDFPPGFSLVASCVMPNGFEVYHFLRRL